MAKSAAKRAAKSQKQAATVAAVQQMNDNLRNICNKWANKLHAVNKNEILVRYEQGKDISNVVTDQRKYGENAAKLLAAAWGISEPLLYNMRRLYNQWKDRYQELKQIVERKNSVGMSLSYSQILAISVLEDPTERDDLIERVFKEDLNTDEIRQIIQDRYGKRSNNASTSPRTPTAGCAVLSKALQKLEESHDKAQTSVFDRIEKDPKEYANEKTIEKLEELVAQIDAAKLLLEDDSRRVKETIETLADTMSESDSDDESDSDGEQDSEDAPVPTPRSPKASIYKAQKSEPKQTSRTVVNTKLGTSQQSAVVARIKAAQESKKNPAATAGRSPGKLVLPGLASI